MPQAPQNSPGMRPRPSSAWGAEAMSQGSDASPLLDPVTYKDNLADLRGADSHLPTFNSNPGTPPPALEAEVAWGNRATQTSPPLTLNVPVHSVQDAATQVISRPHQATSDTQTPPPTTTSDQGTQVLLRPPRSVAYTQTAREPRSTTTTWTQVPRAALKDCGTTCLRCW